MSNRFYCVCGVVMIHQKVLLVRHTYGNAKDKLLIPGGFVQENEMPTDAVIREIYEETSVKTKVVSVIGIQFKPSQWCVVFLMDYVSGSPKSDNYENSEVKLLAIEEALERDDITNMTRQILTSVKNKKAVELKDSGYCAPSCRPEEYALYGNVAGEKINFRF